MANKSNRSWINNHLSDPYVKQAQIDGYRSRAAYKLLEIHDRHHLFKPGMVIVDLGATPGSWSQVCSKLIGAKGKLFALDILPMQPIPDVRFIQGDFTDEAIYNELLAQVPEKIDWVISDMAPNMSGNESVDIPQSVYLCELALQFAVNILKPDGGLLMKILQGMGFDEFIKEVKTKFKIVSIKKPKASRGKSREIYILARNLKV